MKIMEVAEVMKKAEVAMKVAEAEAMKKAEASIIKTMTNWDSMSLT
jgi:hypothetical protein